MVIMLTAKRNKYDIIYNILQEISQGHDTKSAIMKYANLSFTLLKNYLQKLETLGIIKEQEGRYKMTEKGEQVFKLLEEMRKLEVQLYDIMNEINNIIRQEEK